MITVLLLLQRGSEARRSCFASDAGTHFGALALYLCAEGRGTEEVLGVR